MKLELEGQSPLPDPSDAALVEQLEQLDGGAVSFAILSQDPMTYIQAAADPQDGFLLEYQTGSTDQHFRAVGLVEREAVIAAFRKYLRGDASWKDDFEWEPMALSGESASGCGSHVLLGLLVLTLSGWWALSGSSAISG